MFRCPGRWLMMVQFGMAFLAGMGLDLLVSEEKNTFRLKNFIRVGGIVFGGILLIGILVWWGKWPVIHWLTDFQAHQLAEFYSIPIANTYSMIPDEGMINRYFVVMRQFGVGLAFLTISMGIVFVVYLRKVSLVWVKILFLALVLIEL